MKLQTYIYGVPQGFKTFGAPPALAEYFKGFYIKSRTGRRLMVHRLENGETRYSFLVYDGILEYDRQRSFFGMTVITDDASFCSDLPVLYRGFNQLFDHVASSEDFGLFTSNSKDADGTEHRLKDGLVRYAHPDFTSASAGVQKLQGLMAQILEVCLVKAGAGHYDASFMNDVSGSIPAFNPDVDPAKVIDTFRRYRWVTLSSAVAKAASMQQAVPVISECSIADLLTRAADITAQLLEISLHTSADSLAKVNAFGRECDEKLLLIRSTSQRIDQSDKETLTDYQKASDSYKKLLTNIDALTDRLSPSQRPNPQQPTPPQPTPAPKPAPVPKPQSTPKPLNWFDRIMDNSKVAAAGIVILIFVVVSILLIKPWKTSTPDVDLSQPYEDIESNDVVIDELKEAIMTLNFEKAKAIADGRLNEPINDGTIKEMMVNSIKENIARNPQINLIEFKTIYRGLFDKINYEFDPGSFDDFCEAAQFLYEVVDRPYLSVEDKAKALAYIESNRSYFDNYKAAIEKKTPEPKVVPLTNNGTLISDVTELPSKIYLNYIVNGEPKNKEATQNKDKFTRIIRYSFNIGTAYVGTSLQISGFNPNQLELKHTDNSKVFDFRNGKIELNAVVSTRTLIVLGIKGTPSEINIEIMKIEKTK